MKLFKTLLLLFSLTVMISACGDDDDDDNDDSSGSGTMTATVDGNSWEGDIAVQAILDNGVLGIAGTSGDGQINITIGAYNGSGSYAFGDISAPTNIAVWTAGTSTTEIFTSGIGIGSGTVDVTESGGNVSGTFTFGATNVATMTSVSVTDGAFDIDIN